jgi:20S proteasome alpha/beta subunit
MSLVINTTTPEGIVLAADSRQSYRNMKGMARIGSENAIKIFEINRRIGVGIAGLAFLPEGSVQKNVSQFIEEFRRDSKVKNMEVKDVARKLNHVFSQKYQWKEQLEQIKFNIQNDLKSKGCTMLQMEDVGPLLKFSFRTPQGTIENGIARPDPIELLVAGYNQDGTHKVYSVTIPGPVQKLSDGKKPNMEYGSSWIGQGDVAARIVLGFDGRIQNIEFVKEAIQKRNEQEIQAQLRGLEYAIQWGTMSLQDAIDFATLMIQTTSAIQRFSDGINADPGDMPGVGGPINVAVITPDHGFVWVKKKKLHFEDSEVDLDNEPRL